eukprot:maker-scaffold58_size443543-snap-gene-2.10 protein:Tk00695 transcript:maker-scaffold58_size443543-snap-gene-2.10-mRNA-1 annotation:"Aquaporin-3"
MTDVEKRKEAWSSQSNEFSDSRGKLVIDIVKHGFRDKFFHQPSNDLDPSRPRPRMKRVPPLVQKFLAELLGTFLLVIFGDGSIAQFVLGQNQTFLSICFGYGLGLMIGILVSGNVSGGHLNPAVTLAMALLQKCPYICVPVYWAAQYLGAFLGASALYGVYADAIEAKVGINMTSAGIFASYPKDDIGMSTLVLGQTLGTAILLIIILAATDKKNMNVSSGLVPVVIGFGLTAIHISFAYNAGCAINPARDFSPRLLTYIVGFGNVFTADDYFFWIPWLMPHAGAIIGALTYYYLIEHHHRDEDDFYLNQIAQVSRSILNMRRVKIPLLVKQFLAEALGTFLLVVFGDGAIAQFNSQAKSATDTSFMAVAIGYGFALMIGILVSGGVSGGHLNPAVTLAMACLRKCSWKQLPVYWLAQYLGALLGAAVVYGIYWDAFNFLEMSYAETRGIFASYPASDQLSVTTLIMDQLLGTGLLLIIILAVTDSRNMKVSSGLVPLLIGLGLAAIHISLAFNAGCAINPARDFSPRLLTLIAGYGTEVFSAFDYFFWIPLIMPHIGGVIGAGLYYLCVEMHHDTSEEFA